MAAPDGNEQSAEAPSVSELAGAPAGGFDPARVQRNARAMVQQGLRYDGPLGDFFASQAEGIEKKIRSTNQAKVNAGMTGLTDQQIREQVAEKLRQKAPQAEKAIVDAAKGDSKAAATDLKGITELAGTAGSISEAFSSGNPLKILGSLGGLLSNSIVGKYIRAAFQWIIGKFTGKNEGFGDIIARINFDAGMSPVAKALGVDNGDLTAGLLAKDAPAAAPPAATTGAQTATPAAPQANPQPNTPVNTSAAPAVVTTTTSAVTAPTPAGPAVTAPVSPAGVVQDRNFSAPGGTDVASNPLPNGAPPLKKGTTPPGMARPATSNAP